MTVPPSPPAVTTAARTEVRALFGRLVARLAISTAIFFTLFAIKHHVDRTTSGEVLDRAAYSLVTQWMSGPVRRDQLPVVLVDLSPLAPRRAPGSPREEAVTPRDSLWSLILQIARQHPTSIGVDVDFSQDMQGSLDPAHDPTFMLDVLRLSRYGSDGLPATPVFIGTGREFAGTPEEWLGQKEFAPIAASLAALPGQREQLLWSKTKVPSRERDAECPSLGLAVARPALAKLHPRSAQWWTPERFGLVSVDTTIFGSLDDQQVQAGRLVAVDFSQVQNLSDTHLDARAIPSPAEHRIGDRVVIIGDCIPEGLDDRLEVPGSPGKRTRGVYYHASVALSLIKGPLYVPGEQASLALEGILFLMIVLLPFGIQAHSCLTNGPELDTEPLAGALEWVRAGVLFLLGAVLTAWTRVLWTDFIVIVPFMICAALLNRWLPGLLEHLVGILPALAARLVKPAHRKPH